MITIDHFIFPSVLTSLVTLALGIFVLLDYRWKKKTYRAFALYAFSISLWSFAVIRFNANFEDPGLFWGRLLHIGATGIPVFFITFNYYFLRDIGKRSLYFAYGVGLIFLYLILFTDTIVHGVIHRAEYSAPAPGKYYLLYFLFFAWSTVYGISKVFIAYLKSEGLRRRQLKLLVLAFVIGYIGGMKNFLIYVNLHIFPIYPYGTYAILILVVIVLYAILRYHLMDIEVIVKRTLVFTSLFIITYGIFASFALITQTFFEKYIGANKWIGLIPSTIIIVLILRPVENLLVNLTNKFLFQRKYDYKQLLKKFIESVVTVPNLDDVINSTIKFLSETLHIKHCSIFLYNRVKDQYELYSSSGIKISNTEISSEEPIVVRLKKLQNIVSSRKTRKKNVIDLTDPIQNFLESVNADVCIPFLLREELVGFMNLGHKMSDQEYTQEDLDILSDLGRTEAIAISNALLTAETAQNEKRAAIGTLAAGINHEICNPLNIMGTKIQAYSMAKEAGMFKEKSKEDVMKQSDDIMDTCLEQIARIAEITKKLSSFAKPSREVKHQLISIVDALEDTLAVLGHELQLEKIKIVKDIDPNLPKILADRSQIQQILFNIIRNGGQAIKGSGTVTVKAYKNQQNKKVEVDISDTGSGIPEDKLEKIFDPFYTTKAPGKGTGLGLSIVRQLVTHNHGEMCVKSTLGTGTTFTLEFPDGTNGAN